MVYGGGGDDRRFSSESMIEEGAVVRNRQEIIKLPDISEMKLTVKIHESHINQVHLGQPAYVVFDSMPDQRFQGRGQQGRSSARQPEPLWQSQSQGLCHRDSHYRQAAERQTRRVGPSRDHRHQPAKSADGADPGGDHPERQAGRLPGRSTSQSTVPVTVGMYNIKFIEILSGLKEGDRVLLSPPFDTEEKDLGGAIIAEGDSMPIASSANRPSRPARTARDMNPRRGGIAR